MKIALEYMLLLLLVAIQLLVESLPISSSGHVALVHMLTIHSVHVQNWQMSEAMEGLIALPSVIVIACYFWPVWSPYLRQCLLMGSGRYRMTSSAYRCIKLLIQSILYTLCALLTTTLGYTVLRVWCAGPWLYSRSVMVAGFIATGLLHIIASWLLQSNIDRPIRSWSFPIALLLGGVQTIALVPGVSRLAVTYLAARLCGLSHRRSFQISFMIGTPLMAAVAGKELYAHAPSIVSLLSNVLFSPPILGIVGSCLFGLGYAACMLLKMTEVLAVQNRWHLFGWYLLGLGLFGLFFIR